MTRAFRFGRFCVLPRERKVLADEEPVKLGPRALDLLLALLARHGQTIDRRELLDLVWPGRVVEDQNLQVQIVALRKLLGPDAIATLPGRGYRFSLPLHEDPGCNDVPACCASNPAALAGPEGGDRRRFETPTLFGREADMERVCRLMAEHRLVTIAGPGGIGKTCLAQAVAARIEGRHPDGVYFVELAPLADGNLAALTVARSLGLSAGGDQAAPDGLARALRPLSVLILLDNCEHVIDAASRLVDTLLAGTPHVQVLATSQEPLALPREHVYRLEPLSVTSPDAASGVARAGAIELFAARVEAGSPRFTLTEDQVPAVVDICRRLDGIPLAIELAAARVPLLGIDGLRDRLDERLRLLTKGSRTAVPRQRTLRDAFEWSHGLLSADQKAVFRRLGAFVGGFSLPAAQLVASDERVDAWAVLDQLGALIDKSLVQMLPLAEPRYRLLETAREFALDKLAEAGETEPMRRRHALAVLETFDKADTEYLSIPSLQWAERLLPDLDNLREALQWSLGPRGDRELAIALGGCTGAFWYAAGLTTEGARHLERIAPLLDAATPKRSEARLLMSLASLGGNWAVPSAQARAAAGRALELFRQLGDPDFTYRALAYYITLSERVGTPVDEEALLQEMRNLEAADWPPFRKRARRWVESRRLLRRGQAAEHRAELRREIELLRAAGDPRGVWLTSHSLAVAEIAAGNPKAAVDVLEPAVAEIRQRGLLRRQWAQVALLALARVELNDPDAAMPAVREAVLQMQVEGTLWWLGDHLAWLVAQRGAIAGAARLRAWTAAQLAARGEQHDLGNARRALAARLQASFGDAELAQLEADGARLTDNEVVAIVLGDA